MSVQRCPEEVSQALADLPSLDLNALKHRWRKLTGKLAPENLPRHLLVRLIAYRIQADAFGDLDKHSVKFLKDVATQRASAGGPKGVPSLDELNLSSRGKKKLTPGTVIGREHGGTMHHVMVLADGFAWNGQTYRSLSEVAFSITGTKWNGPRFFGIKGHHKTSVRDKPGVEAP
jgi:hypothetical protein